MFNIFQFMTIINFGKKIACFARSLIARYPDSDIEAAVAALALIMSKLRVSDDMIGDF